MFKKEYKPPEFSYAGIGNRDTPPKFLLLITEIAKRLSKKYVLRSGAAAGADSAFMVGTMKSEIYVPWHNYNGFPLRFAIPAGTKELIDKYHPNRNLSKGVKAMHQRNMMIITGPHLDDPVDLVICFTRDGCDSSATRSMETGGTGSAISYADDLEIPIINLALVNSLELLSIHTEIDFMDLELPSLLSEF